MKDQNLDQNLQNQYLAFYTQYAQQQQTTNPYAQIVANVAVVPNENNTIQQKSNVLSLVQNYGSESSDNDDDDDDGDLVIKKIPPEETRLVIDKMASYVAKNGADFEKIVQSKGDPRFDFLNDNHEYYNYYKSKIKEFTVNEEQQQSPQQTKEIVKAKPKKVIGNEIFFLFFFLLLKLFFFSVAPVSFSIKKTKEDAAKEIKSALPMEESSDDEEIVKNEETTAIEVSRTPPQPPPPSIEEKIVQSTETTNGLLDEDPILEMIDLTDDVEEKKDIKRGVFQKSISFIFIYYYFF